jgi:hypothetical protein
MKTINYFLILLLTTGYLQAQTESAETVTPRVFGFGLKANVLNLIDFIDDNLTPTKILLTISPSKNFRLEPEIGLVSTSRKDAKSNGMLLGIGLYPMMQKGRTNIFGGLNVNSLTVNQEQKSSISSQKVEGKFTRFAFGVKIGGEYFIGNHFSIGGDVGIASVKSKYSIKGASNGSTDDPELKSLLTESSIALRIYL